MTEKVECPYCESELDYEWEGDEVSEEEYECYECGKDFFVSGEIICEINLWSQTLEEYIKYKIESIKRVIEQIRHIGATEEELQPRYDEINKLKEKLK